jgi:dUTPase
MSYFGSTFNYSLESKAQKYTLWVVVTEEALKKHANYDFNTKIYTDNLNAGFDLVTAESWSGKDVHLLELGVKAMMTRKDTGETVHYWLAPRSSIYKSGYIMANSMGVIDRSYRGVLKAPVVAVTDSAKGFVAGERHFQIVAPDMGWIEEVRIVSALPDTERGEGGFGSTGR